MASPPDLDVALRVDESAVQSASNAAPRQAWLSRGWQRGKNSSLLPLIGLWGAVIIYFAATKSQFLTSDNITITLEQSSVLFIVAVAETLVLLMGAVDLSVGGIVALGGLVLTLGNGTISPTAAAILTVFAAGLLSAVVNGIPIGFFGMNPFVVTLGAAAIFRGVANVLTSGFTKVLDQPDFLTTLATGKVGPIPVPVLVMLGVLAFYWVVLRHTYFGRNVYAVGGNEEASRLAGISTGRVKFLGFFLLGSSAGIAALILAGRLASVAPTAGQGLELTAIAAVLLGGTSLGGGRGNVIGTAVAVLFLATLQNGLQISGVSSFWQDIVTGFILIVAVGFDQVRRRIQSSSPMKGSP